VLPLKIEPGLHEIRFGDRTDAGLAGVDLDPPERVAEAILEVVSTGQAQADLVPAAYGGSSW